MQLTEEILRERKTGIGGSDCAAVLGISKWSTPLEIYLSKINPDSVPREQTDEMYWGHVHEPAIIKHYEELKSVIVEQPNKIFRNEKYPWLIANVDGIVDKNLLLEVKTTKFFGSEWGDSLTDKIPDEYLIQCAHYCIVLNRKTVDIAALGGGSDFRIYTYEHNTELAGQIIEITHDFWENHVKKLMPPAPVNHSDILKLYQKADETKSLIADDVLAEKISIYNDICSNIKKLDIKSTSLQDEIKLAMKDNAYIIDPDGSKLISWKNQISNRFNTELFKTKHPELYQQFCCASETRVLRRHINLNNKNGEKKC